jgi:hypothetical protein
MKQQEVFKKIGSIIKEINDQYDYLATTKDALNDLELELFVANAHFLAEHSEVLRKLNLQNTPAQIANSKPEISLGEKYFEPVVQQLKPPAEVKLAEIEIADNSADDRPAAHIDLKDNDANEDFSYIRQEPETIRHELILDDSQNWEDENDQGFVSEELTDAEEEIEDTPTVKATKTEPVKPLPEKRHVESKAENKQEELITINQKLSAALSNSSSKITEQVNAKAITDLKQAITLNDKLLYIKDLFNGYNLAYSEAIDILNRFTTFEEADKFLNRNYASKNNWESKQVTADKFYALLKRRY